MNIMKKIHLEMEHCWHYDVEGFGILGWRDDFQKYLEPAEHVKNSRFIKILATKQH